MILQTDRCQHLRTGVSFRYCLLLLSRSPVREHVAALLNMQWIALDLLLSVPASFGAERRQQFGYSIACRISAHLGLAKTEGNLRAFWLTGVGSAASSASSCRLHSPDVPDISPLRHPADRISRYPFSRTVRSVTSKRPCLMASPKSFEPFASCHFHPNRAGSRSEERGSHSPLPVSGAADRSRVRARACCSL